LDPCKRSTAANAYDSLCKLVETADLDWAKKTGQIKSESCQVMIHDSRFMSCPMSRTSNQVVLFMMSLVISMSFNSKLWYLSAFKHAAFMMNTILHHSKHYLNLLWLIMTLLIYGTLTYYTHDSYYDLWCMRLTICL
jgi:hypothetical protein